MCFITFLVWSVFLSQHMNQRECRERSLWLVAQVVCHNCLLSVTCPSHSSVTMLGWAAWCQLSWEAGGWGSCPGWVSPVIGREYEYWALIGQYTVFWLVNHSVVWPIRRPDWDSPPAPLSCHTPSWTCWWTSWWSHWGSWTAWSGTAWSLTWWHWRMHPGTDSTHLPTFSDLRHNQGKVTIVCLVSRLGITTASCPVR